MKEKILEYLSKHPSGKSPTEIGMALGKSYSIASSSVNQPLKSLIKQGRVGRFVNYPGKVVYKLLKQA